MSGSQSRHREFWVQVPLVAASGLMLLLTVACFATTSEAEPLFEAPFYSRNAGALTGRIAVGDLNEDGRPDVAAAESPKGSLPGNVTILLGNGDGTLSLGGAYEAGFDPRGIAISDLNGDGHVDLIVANAYSDFFTLLLGNGDGTFGSRRDYPTNGGTCSAASGDFDADGRMDVALVARGTNTVSVFLNKGSGNLWRYDYRTGPSPYFVTLGDLNEDGHLDLVVVDQNDNNAGSLSLFYGHGDGSFSPKTDLSTGPGPFGAAIGDLNADGHPDLAVANRNKYGPGTLSVLLAQGGGTFAPRTDYATGRSPASVVIGDVNEDGRPDLVVVNDDEAMGSVLLGYGDGTFAPRTDFTAGTGTVDCALVDMNADGHLDLVTCMGSVAIYPGNGQGTFRPGEFHDLGPGRCNAIAMGDFDEDSEADVAVANSIQGTISVLLASGPGRFAPGAVYTTGRALGIAAGDLNGDHHADLAFVVQTSEGSSVVSMLLGNGDGTFRSAADRIMRPMPVAVCLGDLNLDGCLDMLVTNVGGGALADSTFAVLLGNGAGTFREGARFYQNIHPDFPLLADLNSDGRLDVVCVNYSIHAVAVLFGRGDGTFGPKSEYPIGDWISSLAVGDVNADGFPDLAVAHANSITILLGDRSGGFANRFDVAAGHGWGPVAVADVNLDQRADLLVADSYSNVIAVLLGNSGGRFEPSLDFGTGNSPRDFAVADLNGDGRPDLAVGGGLSGEAAFTIIPNRSLSTPVLVEGLDAAATGGGVRLHWRLSPAAQREVESIDVDRATASAGPYATCSSSPLLPAAEMSFEDLGVASERYWYRLVLGFRTGGRTIAGPVGVLVASNAHQRTTLRQPFEFGPGGPIQIQFSLAPPQTPVRLVICDVRGRLLWAARSVARQPGEYTQTWDRRDVEGGLAPRGVYIVRLEAGGTVASRKFVILHR